MITAKQLRQDSWDFVFNNLDSLKTHARYLFPVFLVLGVVDTVIEHYKIEWAMVATILISIYFTGFFALSWHRFSLIGESENKVINPFELQPEDLSFIKLFFVLSAAPTALVFFIFGGVAGSVYVFEENPHYILLAVIIGMVLLIGITWLFLRLAFLLPAKSMRLNIPLNETKVIARGLRLKILWVMTLFTLVSGVVLMIYAITIGLVLISILGLLGMSSEEPSLSADLLGFILSVPIYIVVIVYAALNITVLSRAYQWGMQNNR